MISADKTISTNKLITTDRMAGKEKNSGRNKLTDGKAERVKATATEALPVVRGELARSSSRSKVRYHFLLLKNFLKHPHDRTGQR